MPKTCELEFPNVVNFFLITSMGALMAVNNNLRKSKSLILASNEILVPNKSGIRAGSIAPGQTVHAYNMLKGESGFGNIDHVTVRDATQVSMLSIKGVPGFHALAQDQMVLTLKGNWTPVWGLVRGSRIAGLIEGRPAYLEVAGAHPGPAEKACTVRMSEIHTMCVAIDPNIGILTPDVTTFIGTKFTPLPPASTGRAPQFKARQVAPAQA